MWSGKSSGNQDLQQTFRRIARCPNVRLCLETDASSHPCSEIVHFQVAKFGVTSYEDFQLPEPWTGEIDRAPILFIGSNPSIGFDKHSLGSSTDHEVWDSHHHVFGGGLKDYTIEGKYTTNPDGERNLPHVATWAGVRKRAEELIPDRPVVPGIDYALTEVVHCKSLHEIGVNRALKTCTDLHFDSVMHVAVAPVLVALGKARDRIRQMYDIPNTPGIVEMEIGGRPRLIAFLGHPTGPEVRTFGAVYPTELRRLREAISSAKSAPP